jgi:hypothetical protein
MNDDPLKTAIELIRAGQKAEAQKILQPIINADAHNIPAWFWYVESCSTGEQRLRILEKCAGYNPDHPQVKAALEILRRQAPTPPAKQNPPAAAEMAQPSPKPVTNQTAQRMPAARPRANKPWNFASVAIWAIAGILIIVLSAAMIYMVNSRPADPAAHRYTQPIEYYLYVPKAYDPNVLWPLFIGIHGSGGTGLNCWNLWQLYAEQEGFILLCPTLSETSEGWQLSSGESNTWAAINQVSGEYSIRQGFFIAGFLAGAQFVQGFCYDYPESVQAVAVLSARNYYQPPAQVGGIPFLVVIGDRDEPNAIESSKQFVQAAADNGSSVEYWLLPGVAHQATSQTKQLTIDFYHSLNNP